MLVALDRTGAVGVEMVPPTQSSPKAATVAMMPGWPVVCVESVTVKEPPKGVPFLQSRMVVPSHSISSVSLLAHATVALCRVVNDEPVSRFARIVVYVLDPSQ